MRRVQNLDRLNRRIRRLPDAIKAAIREALEQGATEVVAEMKRLAPVDEGALRDSIGWTFGRPPAGTMVLGAIDERDMQGLRVTIYAGGPEAYYARWVEFGTQHQPAHPYFYVVWRAYRRRIKSRITRKVNAAIKRIANSG